MSGMTEAIIYVSGNGSAKGFKISGHATPRKRLKKGEYDLVCAAISAIGFTAVGALGEICGAHDYREQDGNLEMMIPADLSPELAEKAGIITRTMEIGLKQIEEQYPEHLHVLNKEV